MKPMTTLMLVMLLAATGSARGAQPADSLSTGQRIEQVVVTGTRNGTDVRHLPMTVSTVSRTQIEERNSPSLYTVLSEQIPSLFHTRRGVLGYGVSGGAAGGLSLRGISGGSGALMVLIDGHPQYMGLMGHPVADTYHSIMAERVEVLRGPASTLYGSNAMGGVINIVTRRAGSETASTDLNLGYGSYNTLQSSLTQRIRKGRFYSTMSASYDRTDGHRPDMGFEQESGLAKIGYEISGNWQAYADLNITHFDASNPGAADAPLLDADQGITRGAVSAAVENTYEKTSGAVSVFYSWGHHTVNDGYSPGTAPKTYLFNSRDYMTGISVYQSIRLFEGNRLTAGIDYFQTGGKSWNQPLDGSARAMLADKVQHQTAAYVDFRQQIGRAVTLDAGIRADYNSHAGRAEWVPQIGASFHLPAETELKAMVSKGFRYPTIREMYMFAPANADLLPESLWNYEISYTQRAGMLDWGVNLFFIDGKNMIQTVPVDGRPKNINTGFVQNAGLEAQLSARISNSWTADANYSFLHMKYPVLAAPQHKLYAGGQYRHRRWSASVGVQYIDGLYTAVGDRPRTENFVLLDIRASLRVCRNMSIWARGENLLAQRYEIIAGFPMPRATAMGGIQINF